MLALAYAQRYPERVRALLLTSVTTMRQAELDWLYEGARAFFPEAWERFRAAVPRAADESIPAAYVRAMESPDAALREGAARAWCAWEDAVLSLERPANAPLAYGDRPLPELVAFVRICARYVANRAWLADGELVTGAAKLAGIPGVLIHGRRDLSAPLRFAYELANAWPGARLIALDDAGHLASPSKREALMGTVSTLSTFGPADRGNRQSP